MSMDEQNANWGNFFNGDLPGKVCVCVSRCSERRRACRGLRRVVCMVIWVVCAEVRVGTAQVGTVLLLLALSRVGVYIPIDGVDRAAFAESMSQVNLSYWATGFDVQRKRRNNRVSLLRDSRNHRVSLSTSKHRNHRVSLSTSKGSAGTTGYPFRRPKEAPEQQGIPFDVQRKHRNRLVRCC
jgi:hypothetical protein